MDQREQQQLKEAAAQESDPDKRELIELRRKIEANDYMAITSERLSAMSVVITGNRNSEEAHRQQERAEYFAAQAMELREQRRELQERMEREAQEREAQRTSSTAAERSELSATGAVAGQDNRTPA